ncbi:hypothetical protein MD484_g2747, partial [Candolleomyces efflorescens]
MAAIIGGTVGGLVLIGALIVGIVVPLVRRRWLRKQVTGRAPVNLDLPFEKEDRSGVGLLPIIGEKKQYPTTESGAHFPRESDIAGLLPLLGGGGRDPASPRGQSTFSSSMRHGGSVLSQPPSIRYPTVSSTHMYQKPQKHEELYFYYRTESSATGGVGAGGAMALRDQDEDGDEFDPYAQYLDKPSPLDAIRDSLGKRAIELERPDRALKPSSPKKATRTLPVPFEDDIGNPFAQTDSTTTYPNPNPFISSSEQSRSPFSPTFPTSLPAGTTSTQANVDNATIRGSRYFASNTLGSRTRSPSPKRPSFFSYRSSSTVGESVKGGRPPLPRGAQQPSMLAAVNPFLSPPPPPPPSLITGQAANAEVPPVLPVLDLGGPVREPSGGSFNEVANAKLNTTTTTTTTKPTGLGLTTPSANANPTSRVTPDSDTLSMYSQMSPVGSLRRDSVVINNPFFGSVESANVPDRRSFVGLSASNNPFFGSVGSVNSGRAGGGLGAVDEGQEVFGREEERADGEEVVLVKRKAVKTQIATTAGGGSRSAQGRAGVQSLRGDVVGTIQVPTGGVDEYGRQQQTEMAPVTLGEDTPWLVPSSSHLKERSTASASTSSSSGSNFNKPLIQEGSVKGAASLSRMDTMAIGNLIKSRAAKIVVGGGDVEGQHERAVSMIERHGSIRGVEEGPVEGQGDSGKAEPVVRGRGIQNAEEGMGEGYGEIRRVPVKRTVTPTITTATAAPSENATVATGTPPPTNAGVHVGTKTPSPAGNNVLRRRSRSNSRGRLVPKVSLKRPSTGEGSDGIKRQNTGDDDTSTTPTPSPIPIGRSPSRKYKPKASLSLQQRLVEKGLLSVSTPDLLEGEKGVSTLGASSSMVTSPVGPSRPRRQHRRTGSTPTTLSTVATSPSQEPYSSSIPGQEGKPRVGLEVSTSMSASSSETTANPDRKHNSLFPLTGAFGLAKSPSKRSPATPTYQYAFADLERTKEFLPVTEPLKVVMGPRTSPGGQGKLRKPSAGGGAGKGGK